MTTCKFARVYAGEVAVGENTAQRAFKFDPCRAHQQEQGARGLWGQHSTQFEAHGEQLVHLVDAVADAAARESKLNSYVRTFSYTQKGYASVPGAIALLQRLDIRLMMKETPHDFFLTHPDNPYARTIARAAWLSPLEFELPPKHGDRPGWGIRRGVPRQDSELDHAAGGAPNGFRSHKTECAL